MTEQEEASLRDLLIRHEGTRNRPYRDPTGNLTIGVGRNLSAVPLSADEIDLLLTNDIARAKAGLDRNLPWWTTLSVPRQMVLIDMCFNLGIGGLLQFRKFLAAVQAGDWSRARAEMDDSLWARQVGRRARELAEMMDPSVERKE